MTKTVDVYFREEHVTTLGPGSRYVLWVNGCLKACPGCIYHKHSSESDYVEIDTLVNEILECSGIEGITLSGGEPTLQAEALSLLLERVKEQRDLGVIMYSGYKYEELLKRAEQDTHLKYLLSFVDLLIDGEYVEVLDQNQSLIGSANQVVHNLTNRYKNQLNEYGITGARKSEIRLRGRELHFIGLPSKESAKVIQYITQKGVKQYES